jgi:AbrB family looped-hinge helix DNA binding protein
MASATITSNGQVTIPRRIREVLRLSPGDWIVVVTDDEGRVIVRPRTKYTVS